MHPYLSEALAHERQTRLQAEARQSRLVATTRGARRRSPNETSSAAGHRASCGDPPCRRPVAEGSEPAGAGSSIRQVKGASP